LIGKIIEEDRKKKLKKIIEMEEKKMLYDKRKAYANDVKENF
jgi:hypothetical protein